MAEPKQPQNLKSDSNGILLAPQPPLKWPLSKKVRTLAILSFPFFVGIAQALTKQSGFFVQGALYRKTTVQMSYVFCKCIFPFLSSNPIFSDQRSHCRSRYRTSLPHAALAKNWLQRMHLLGNDRYAGLLHLVWMYDLAKRLYGICDLEMAWWYFRLWPRR